MARNDNSSSGSDINQPNLLGPCNLIGRNLELREVHAVLKSIESGRRELLLIEGAPGSGKTSFLREIAAAAVRRRIELIPDGCIKSLDEISSEHIHAIAQSHFWDATPGDESQSGKILLVVLDDLHSADPDQVHALRALSLQSFKHKVSWIVARQPFAESRKVDQLINTVGVTKRVELGPLNEDAIEQVVRRAFGADADHGLLDFASGAGGNPHLLLELVQGLDEERLVQVNNGMVRLVSRRLPHRVLASVRRQMADLSGGCEELLKVAAILGRSFTLEDVSTLLGRPPATLLSLVEEALASGFVVAAEHQLTFQCELLWRSIIESIPAHVHSTLQRAATGRSHRRRLTAAPNACCGASGLGQKSWIIERAAGRPSAVDGNVEVCSEAHSLTMSGKAKDGVRVAESVLANPDVSDHVRFDAEAAIILGYSLIGGVEAEEYAERLMRERGACRGDVATMMAMTILSNARWRAGNLAEGLNLGRSAVRQGDCAGPGWRLHSQLALAGKLANLRQFDEAEALIDDTEAGLRGLDTQIWTAAPAAVRSRLFLQAGRFEDARRQAELATTAVGAKAVPILRPLALSVLSAVALHMGDMLTAAEHSRHGQSELAGWQAVLDSVQHAWTEVRIVAQQDAPRRAVELLSNKYGDLVTRRSLYIEDPAAAPWLIRLAVEVGDADLKCGVLQTVDSLARDNPDISVVNLAAMHAGALVSNDSIALKRIVTETPDKFCAALAAEDLAIHYVKEAPIQGQRAATSWFESALTRFEEMGAQQDAARIRRRIRDQGGTTRSPVLSISGADEGWFSLTNVERSIAYLVSLGATNRQIARRVHLSPHTVNYHLRKVYRKLNINTRTELARRATMQAVRSEETWT